MSDFKLFVFKADETAKSLPIAFDHQNLMSYFVEWLGPSRWS